MAEGKVTAKENDAVQIDGIWYRLGEKVKANFLRMGECEYSVDPNDEESVSFVKMKKSEKPKTFGKPKESSGGKGDGGWRDPSEIIRQECLNTAKDVLIANKEKEPIEWKTLLILAERIEQYVVTGEIPKDE